MTANITQLPTRHARPLDEADEQLISRALEAWAWRARREADNLTNDGMDDEASVFSILAERADGIIQRVPWLRDAS